MQDGIRWCLHQEENSRSERTYQDMLLDFIEAETDRLSERARQPLTPDKWPQARDEVHRRVCQSLGLHPMPDRTDLHAHVTGTTKFTDYRIERVVFEPRPAFKVPGLLYLPNVEGPAPAVLYSIGHWMRWSKSEPDIQAACVGLAKLGFVVFTFDPIGQHEREPNFHDHAHRELLPLGLSQEGITVWEHIRAIDYMVSRPEVDANRIGMTGASGGGLTTFFTSAIDDRIRVSVPVCYVSSYSQFLRAVRGTNWDNVEDLCNQIPNMISVADAAGIAGLIAPRPLLMINGSQDPHFPVEGAEEVKRQTAPVYGVAAADRIRVAGIDADHGYDKQMREAAYGWFRLWLQGEGDGSPVPEPEMTLFPVDAPELRSFGGPTISSSASLTNFVKTTAAQMGLRPGDNTLKRIDEGVVLRVLGMFLAAKHTVSGTLEASAEFAGVRYERHLIATEPGITVPAFLIQPIDVTNRYVMCLDDQIKTSGCFSFAVEESLSKGWGVIAIDPRGVGETVPVPPETMTVSTLEGPLLTMVPGADEFLEFEAATDSILLGRCLLGQQVTDVMRCLDYFIGEAGSVKLLATGPLSSLRALFAASLDARISGLAAHEFPISSLDLVLNDSASMPITAYVYDLLRHFDFKDLVTLMPGKNLFLTNPVDAANHAVPLEECRHLYLDARQYLQSTGGQLSIGHTDDLREHVKLWLDHDATETNR